MTSRDRTDPHDALSTERVHSGPAAVDPAEAASVLLRVVDVINKRELSAPPVLIARLEGAIVALEPLAGGRMPIVEDLL